MAQEDGRHLGHQEAQGREEGGQGRGRQEEEGQGAGGEAERMLFGMEPWSVGDGVWELLFVSQPARGR